MTLLDVSKLDAVGAPLYDMRKIFQIDAPASKISFSLITIQPGSRVPEVGDRFSQDGWEIQVTQAERHRVAEIQLRREAAVPV